jgi:hypothetical protein
MSCSSKKPIAIEKPSIQLPVNNVKLSQSNLVLHYSMSNKGIQDTFDRAIVEVFRHPFEIPDYGIKMTLSKPKPSKVAIEGKQITTTLPVNILAEKSTFLANLSAKGQLEMTFTTAIDMDSLWNFKSKTILSNHKWLEQPKLAVGGISIPIETISNAIIRKTKTDLEKTIDQSILESFTIKNVMTENMEIFRDPISLGADFNGWLSLKPEQILISKVKSDANYAKGKMQMKLSTKFTTGQPDKSAKLPLPKLYWSESIPDSSSLMLTADIKMKDVNDFIKKNFDGQEFEAEGKKITINQTNLSAESNFINVSTMVSGSIDGNLIIKTKPKYDEIKNELSLEVEDVGLKTKNVAIKAITWIAKGKIKKEMEEILKFPLNTYMSQAQNIINDQVTAFNNDYGLRMGIKMGSLKITSLEVLPGQISTAWQSKLWLDLLVTDFRSFNKF